MSGNDFWDHSRARPSPVDCQVFRDLVSGFVDAQTDVTQEQLLNSHLAGCASCSAYKNTLESFPYPTIRPRPVTERDEHDISSLTVDVLHLVAARRRSEQRLRHQHRRLVIRFAFALLPLATSAAFLSSGAFAHSRIVATHSKTPCTRLIDAPYRLRGK